MRWTKPEFKEVVLGMEVTAYVNTDESVDSPSTRKAEAAAEREAEAVLQD